MKKQDQSLHQQLVESTEQVRLAHDNLEASRYTYFESPTDVNRRRVDLAKRDYLIAVEERESVLESLSELEATEHYP